MQSGAIGKLLVTYCKFFKKCTISLHPHWG
jgi:hypothetical protein